MRLVAGFSVIALMLFGIGYGQDGDVNDITGIAFLSCLPICVIVGLWVAEGFKE